MANDTRSPWSPLLAPPQDQGTGNGQLADAAPSDVEEVIRSFAEDGLVNVSVGDISILNNANVGVAANVAAAVCGVNVGPVAILAVNTAATGTQNTVCTIGDQAVKLTQAQ